jgi:excisionase family DNA binding protein
MSTVTRSRFCGTKEVAAFLNCKEQRIRVLVFERRIPYRKFGKRLLFDLQEVERYFESLPGLSAEDIRQ